MPSSIRWIQIQHSIDPEHVSEVERPARQPVRGAEFHDLNRRRGASLLALVAAMLAHRAPVIDLRPFDVVVVRFLHWSPLAVPCESIKTTRYLYSMSSA